MFLKLYIVYNIQFFVLNLNYSVQYLCIFFIIKSINIFLQNNIFLVGIVSDADVPSESSCGSDCNCQSSQLNRDEFDVRSLSSSPIDFTTSDSSTTLDFMVKYIIYRMFLICTLLFYLYIYIYLKE